MMPVYRMTRSLSGTVVLAAVLLFGGGTTSLAIAGAFDPAEALTLVERYFGWMPRRDRPRRSPRLRARDSRRRNPRSRNDGGGAYGR